MSKETLMEKIDKLPPEQLSKVEAFVNELNQPSGDKANENKERQLQQRLLELGLLSEIKAPITDLTPYEHRQPIIVTGQPTSEIIIEERR